MPSAEEMEVFNEIVASALDDLNLSSVNNDCAIDVKTCRNSFDDLAMAAEIIDLKTLGDICKAYSDSFLDQQDDNSILSTQKTKELNRWSQDLISYIRSPNNKDFAERIITIFPQETKDHFLSSLIPGKDNEYVPRILESSDSPLAENEIKHLTEPTSNGKHVINIPLSTPSNDPIYLFISELNEMEKKIDDSLANLLTATIDEAPTYTKQYLKLIDRIRSTAEILDIQGLVSICQFVENNLLAMDLNNEETKPIYFELLSPIPHHIRKLLSNMGDSENILDIITLFENTAWPKANDETESHNLIILLSDSNVTPSDEQPQEERKTTATLDDVSLALSQDIHPELFSAFFQDAPHQASSLSNCIASLSTTGNATESIDSIEDAQRLTHALKGSANIVEIFGVANMAHYLEEVLESLHAAPENISHPLVELLIQCSDCIESMIDFLLGKEKEPTDAQSLLQQLLDVSNGQEITVNNTPDISSNNTSSNNISPSNPSPTLPEKSAIAEDFIQVPSKTIESLFDMVEVMTISLIQTREQVKKMMEGANNQGLQDEKIQEHRFELEKIVDIKALSSSKKRNIANNISKSNFDSLELDQYSEIHGTVHSFIETVIDSRELNIDMREQLLHLDSLFVKHMRLNKDLQFLTKSTKMVSVTSISSRLQRCVRHAARVTEKQVSLTIVDNNLSVDEEILSQLTDPLMHILRNAIDHGIETDERRRALGKTENGNISIEFSQLGNHIRIQCKDDGQGINATEVQSTAIKKGLILNTQELDEAQCIELLLTSGFSTKDSANQISGRGVGLDVVNASIKKLNGKIGVSSKLDIGTNINVTVPLSHLSTHAIIISLNYDRYAIPSHSLLQLLAPHSGEVVNYGMDKGYRYNDTVYPLITIGDLLLGQCNHNKQHITINNLPIVLLDVHGTTYALAVDSIQSNQEIIIKPMGNYIKKTPGVNGVAIIADGTLIPVLDISELIENPSMRQDNNISSQEVAPEQRTAHQPTVMIVDDSLSVRRSLDQLMRDMGYDTVLAQDGVQAVEQFEQEMPDVILTDMEMPRMNGLELTSYIKKSERLSHLPVIMITSRSTQKHRQLAAQNGANHYLTKPYTESQLLDLVGCLIPKTP